MPLTQEARQKLVDELARRGVTYGAEKIEGVAQPGTWSKWCPFEPLPKQRELLAAKEREILYGGAAGGAKSVGILMWMCQDLDRPGFRGVIVRKTLTALESDGALMDKATEWWRGSGAKWDGKAKAWTFPSGARVSFMHLANKQALESWQGGERWKIAIDEAGQIPMNLIQWVRTRLRVPAAYGYKPQLLLTANPGGVSHEDLELRFMGKPEEGIEPKPNTRFIPSSLADNPHLDAEEYAETFDGLDPTTRQQLLDGDWNAVLTGNYAQPAWFKKVSALNLPRFTQFVRFWDVAITIGGDYTVGLLMAKAGSVYYVLDVVRLKRESPKVKELITRVAASDPPGTIVAMENQTVSIQVMQDLRHSGYFEYRTLDEKPETQLWLYGAPNTSQRVRLVGVPQKGDKLAKASGFFNGLASDLVRFVDASWFPTLQRELCNFANKDGEVDDQVDAAGGAYQVAMKFSGVVQIPKATVIVPGSREEHELIRSYSKGNGKQAKGWKR